MPQVLIHLAAKSYFDTLKTEADKLDINKLVNIFTGLNKLKTETDDLDFGKLQTLPIDFKKK